VPPERWAFIDTETSGLAGGSGTFAFLVGGGAITPGGFVVDQFVLREPAEEASQLEGFTEWLSGFDVMVTYNGRAFDIPLLETRYRLARMKPPFARLRHIDLLYSARRLWRLALERCRLQDLEVRILGFERVGDTPGALIPQLYFDFLRTGNARPLEGVFEHNALDILSLACLAGIVPAAFRDPARLRSAAEMLGIARWLRNEQRFEEALALMREAVKRPLTEVLLFETLWQMGDLERRLDRHDAAVALWSELSTVANPWRAQALERLAIHYEHRERNPAMALEMTRAALAIEPSEALIKRQNRLQVRANRPKSGRLL
jgi:tetratricopeptide (TPR) repeat protein